MTVNNERGTVLLTGASGFIGQHIAAALREAGHYVWRGVSPRSYAKAEFKSKGITKQHVDKHFPSLMPIDFAKDSEDDWHQRFYERRRYPIEFVINAVGVLRDSKRHPIEATHQSGPIALFNACAGHSAWHCVKRVIQISALGVEDSPTRYASTKRAADEHLLKLAESAAFSASVVRPSIVFGKAGASSALFMNLARLPLLLLPQPVLQAQVQPLAVSDLVAAVLALLKQDSAQSGIVECAGPQALRLADFIASLRQQCGRNAAKVLRLPNLLTRLSARAGDFVPVSPWCSESLALLGKDNIADAATLRTLLGREAIHYSQLVASAWNCE